MGPGWSTTAIHEPKIKVSGMSENHPETTLPEQPVATPDPPQNIKPPERPKEYGGPKGPEPTRYGDWEKKGITSDF